MMQGLYIDDPGQDSVIAIVGGTGKWNLCAFIVWNEILQNCIIDELISSIEDLSINI